MQIYHNGKFKIFLVTHDNCLRLILSFYFFFHTRFCSQNINSSCRRSKLPLGSSRLSIHLNIDSFVSLPSQYSVIHEQPPHAWFSKDKLYNRETIVWYCQLRYVGLVWSLLLIIYLFEWYMVRLVVKTGHPKSKCYNTIGLCAHNTSIVLGLTTNTNKTIYLIV